MKKYIAEMVGTMVLVLFGCGAAVFNGGCGTTAQVLTVAFAFGISVIAMVYTIGNISGCHINPAITLGFIASGRMKVSVGLGYMAAQVLGAFIGSTLIFLMVSGYDMDFVTQTGANGWTDSVSMSTAMLAEIIGTFVFVLVVLGVTDSKKGNPIAAGLAIGLCLTMVHIVLIPITGTSVNPARSIGPALFEGGKALSQLWLFIVAPFIGALLSALVWGLIKDEV